MWRTAHHPTMPSRRDLLAGLAGAGLAATAGCLADDDPFSAGSDATTDWPMARHDPANTASAPDAVAPRTGVTERWRKKVGSRVDGIVPADNGVVVSTFGGGTGGGGLTFGAERWSQSLDVNFVQGLAVGDGALFAACEATEDGDSLVRLDPA